MGFIVFGIASLYAIVMIFIDISKRDKSYDEDIDNDLKQMKELGLMKNMAEYDAELAIRLSGVKVEDTGDDQLIGAAIQLSSTQYSKYM